MGRDLSPCSSQCGCWSGPQAAALSVNRCLDGGGRRYHTGYGDEGGQTLSLSCSRLIEKVKEPHHRMALANHVALGMLPRSPASARGEPGGWVGLVPREPGWASDLSELSKVQRACSPRTRTHSRARGPSEVAERGLDCSSSGLRG